MTLHRITLTRRAVLAGAAAALAAPTIARAQATTWRLGTQMPTDHPIHFGVVKVAEEVQRRSNGRLRIDVFPAGQLGTGVEMDQQVSDGSLEFALDGPGQLGSWVRTLTIFEAPFISRDWDHLVKMVNSDWGQAQFRTLASQRNMQKVGPAWYYGTRHLTTRDRAVRVPADARGLKIRVPAVPTFLEMIRAIGATPTPMALAEVYLSLQTGVADGQENPLPTIAAQKFYEVQRFLNLTGHIITPQITFMNARLYNSLPDADKEILAASFAEGGRVNDQKFREMEGSLIADFRQRGMTIVESDRPAFQQAMAPVYPRFEEIWGRGIADQLRAIQ